MTFLLPKTKAEGKTELASATAPVEGHTSMDVLKETLFILFSCEKLRHAAYSAVTTYLVRDPNVIPGKYKHVSEEPCVQSYPINSSKEAIMTLALRRTRHTLSLLILLQNTILYPGVLRTIPLISYEILII